MANVFTCVVITPEAEVFRGEVTYASVPLHDGSMGFEVNRAPILGGMGYGVLCLTGPSETTELFCGGGFAQMQGDTLTILTPEAMPKSELDAKAAQDDLATALELSGVGDTAADLKQKRVDRARGMLAATSS